MTTRLHVELDIDLDPGRPMTGSLRSGAGSERRFVGWLDLLAALEAACAVARAAHTRTREEPGER